MRTTIKAEVHLLATEESPIFKNKGKNNELSYRAFMKNGQFTDCQHLYFTTDEKMKEDNWFIGDDGALKPNIYISSKIKNNYIYTHNSYQFPINRCRKIVATTNPELWKNTKYNMDIAKNSWFNAIHKTESSILIPKIGNTFIEAYIKAYNEGKPITEVLLEVDSITNTQNHTKKYQVKFLKLKANSSVVVHPIKEKMYSREEFRKAVRDAWIHSNGIVKFEEWFDKNYPE